MCLVYTRFYFMLDIVYVRDIQVVIAIIVGRNFTAQLGREVRMH